MEIKLIPISYWTYNKLNFIACLVIISFTLWFAFSDECEITMTEIWVPSIIALGLLFIGVGYLFSRDKLRHF